MNGRPSNKGRRDGQLRYSSIGIETALNPIATQVTGHRPSPSTQTIAFVTFRMWSCFCSNVRYPSIPLATGPAPAHAAVARHRLSKGLQVDKLRPTRPEQTTAHGSSLPSKVHRSRGWQRWWEVAPKFEYPAPPHLIVLSTTWDGTKLLRSGELRSRHR